MSRKVTLSVIAVIVLMTLATWLFKQGTKAERGRAQTTANYPFRNAVVELTFRSRTINQGGEELLSSSGRRTEYIDAAYRRRREDYEIDNTSIGKFHSTQSHTLIFDGRNVYMVTNEDGNRKGWVTDLGEGYDYHVWEDALVEQLIKQFKKPGTRIEEQQEQFLGRQCTVYTVSDNGDISKWWVWNGVTLRSELHSGKPESGLTETSEEAVRVEEDGELDSQLFSRPTDVTFTPVTEATSQSQQEAHQGLTPWMRISPEVNWQGAR